MSAAQQRNPCVRSWTPMPENGHSRVARVYPRSPQFPSGRALATHDETVCPIRAVDIFAVGVNVSVAGS
jgi:hypothetical protein